MQAWKTDVKTNTMIKMIVSYTDKTFGNLLSLLCGEILTFCSICSIMFSVTTFAVHIFSCKHIYLLFFSPEPIFSLKPLFLNHRYSRSFIEFFHVYYNAKADSALEEIGFQLSTLTGTKGQVFAILLWLFEWFFKILLSNIR